MLEDLTIEDMISIVLAVVFVEVVTNFFLISTFENFCWAGGCLGAITRTVFRIRTFSILSGFLQVPFPLSMSWRRTFLHV